MPITNKITCLGWPCTITLGTKVWHNEQHTASKNSGTLWFRHDKVTAHLPPELGGDKELDGFLQTKEQKVGQRLVTSVTAHCRDQGIIQGEFGLISFVKWLLEKNGVAPKQLAKKERI